MCAFPRVDPRLELRDVRLRAGARGYPNGIDLTLRAGEAVAVCTSARAGAALVRSILGFAEVLSGEIYVLGERVPLPRGGEPFGRA